RQSTSYHWFRKRVPTDIVRSPPGETVLVTFPASGADPQVTVSAKLGVEINFSLRTRNPRTAKARTGIATAHLEQLFERLRAGPTPLSQKQCVALSGEVYRLFVYRFDDNTVVPETRTSLRSPH